MLRSPVVSSQPRNRSAVTNGKRSFVEGDGKTAWARRWRDLTERHVDDIGPHETLSQAQISLCKRAATLEVQLEGMEGVLSMGGEIDLDLFNRASGNLRRLLETLGIERRRRDVTPTLGEYLSIRPVFEVAE